MNHVKPTSKFLLMKNDNQSAVVRIESVDSHEEDAAIAASPHFSEPITSCLEVSGEVAFLEQTIFGALLIDPELSPA